MPLLRDSTQSIGSPYLLSHANNPVNWWSWGDDAFETARQRDLPVFLSIGYASCHWCHVMAHESFEDNDVAALLNDNFIAIKVDREERPDVDALYMAATQLVSGSGGWPMSVFLTPSGQPFMAGTYYPRVDRPGLVGFTHLLQAMTDAWRTQRRAVLDQADQIAKALSREVAFIDHLDLDTHELDLPRARARLRDELVARCDERGGFGGAPKFPRPSYVDALLEFDDPESEQAVFRTLENMSRGGLYDHLEGGFARYSVDAMWHVPHFEKMLSDQALLARTYLRAARRFPQYLQWRSVAIDTLHFVCRVFAKGDEFISSLDADADGVEGSHVTWSVKEVSTLLASQNLSPLTERVLQRYRITSPGLFEGRSIPRLADHEPFSTPEDLTNALEVLGRARANRPQPNRDDKVILEWNAMLASALFLSDISEFVATGERLLDALWRTHFVRNVWWRTDHVSAYATASDIAWLLDAHLDGFEATGEHTFLSRASQLVNYLLTHYWDGDIPTTSRPTLGGGLFAQCDLAGDLILRPKEIFDGATPSAHAVGCRSLARYALCTGDEGAQLASERLVALAQSLLSEHPSAVPDLVDAAGFALEGLEVVIPGPRNELSEHVRSMSMTRTVLITGSSSTPLLRDRVEGWAYVCRRGVCQLPVQTIDALDLQMASERR